MLPLWSPNIFLNCSRLIMVRIGWITWKFYMNPNNDNILEFGWNDEIGVVWSKFDVCACFAIFSFLSINLVFKCMWSLGFELGKNWEEIMHFGVFSYPMAPMRPGSQELQAPGCVHLNQIWSIDNLLSYRYANTMILIAFGR